MKINMSESIQSHFTRVSQIKEHLEANGDNVEEVEVELTTLNGLPRSWESFIQGFFSRRDLTYGRNEHKKKLKKKIWEKLTINP